MRKLFTVSLVLCATLALALNAVALERVGAQSEIVRDDVRNPGGWTAGSSTCSLFYHNYCTGWVSIWSFTVPNVLIGQVVDAADCCGSGSAAALDLTVHRAREEIPAGYGFTGTYSIFAADAQDCPTGAAIASQPYLPATPPFTILNWGGVPVPARFVYQLNTGGLFNAGSIYTGVESDLGGDAAGTEPRSCPQCFPCDRQQRSFIYGTATSPYCPGATLEPETDGAGNTTDTDGAKIEWRAIYVMTCGPVSVENESWGSVKNLYR